MHFMLIYWNILRLMEYEAWKPWLPWLVRLFDDQSPFKMVMLHSYVINYQGYHRKAPSNFRIYINIHKLLQSCDELLKRTSLFETTFQNSFWNMSPRRHVLATYMTRCPGKAQSQHPQRYVWDSTVSKEINNSTIL